MAALVLPPDAGGYLEEPKPQVSGGALGKGEEAVDRFPGSDTREVDTLGPRFI